MINFFYYSGIVFWVLIGLASIGYIAYRVARKKLAYDVVVQKGIKRCVEDVN